MSRRRERTTRRAALAAAAAVVLCLAGGASRATTYVLPSDGALVDQAPVIAQVSVSAVEPSPISGPPSTDYLVQIERVLKGYVTGGTVVVRVPGGIGPDGMGLRIWGAPQFREAERVLLFLAPRDDGTYGIVHLMLGAFYELESGGRRVAARALDETVELSGLGGGRLAGIEPLRDFPRFLEWIRDRVEGGSAKADYLLPRAASIGRTSSEHPGRLRDRCTYAGFRWSEIDRGESVPWHIDWRGFDGSAVGRRSFERARRIWTRRSGVPIRLGRATRSRVRAGFSSFDGVNALLFNDPNDVMSGSFRCSSGGLVSLSGVWFENGRGQSCERVGAGRKASRGGRAYLEILGADIVTNDGAACLLRRDVATATDVMAHELGHSLGLAHSVSDEEIMWGEVRRPRAVLGEGDLENLSALYGATDSGRPPGR